MKMTDGTKSLLFIIAGLALIAIAYFFFISGNIETYNDNKSEIEALTAQYNDLVSKQSKRSQYVEDTDKFNNDYEEVLNKFPAALNQENVVMFVKGIEDNYKVASESVDMGIPEQYYVLGSGTVGTDGAVSTTDTTTENATTDTTTEVVADDAITSEMLTAYKVTYPIKFSGEYDGLKQFMDYIIGYKYRVTIDTMNIAYNAEDDIYSGDFEISFYDIEGDSRVNKDDIQLDDVKTGVNNIFNSNGSGSTSGGSKLNLFDEDQGAAIEDKYDFFARINPTSSDVAGKLVGTGGNGKALNDISSDKNESEDISFAFSEYEGKKYVTYSIAGEEKEVEVTSEDYVTLLIQSSDLKDDKDKNAASIEVSNNMSIPVYVKIVGDETASRLKVTKSGSVKVYK